MFLPKDDFLSELRDNNLRDKARTVLERDAKHALNSSDPEERLLGIRAVQSFLDY
jgi:hypothetical protein